MASIGELFVDIKADTTQLDKQVDNLWKQSITVWVSVDIAKLKVSLREAQEALKEAIFRGDTANEIKIRANIDDIQQKMSQVRKEAKTTTDSLWSIGGALVGAGITFALSSIANWVVTLAWNLQQARIAFTTMIWSASEAEVLLKDLAEFAKRTPFELVWLREQSKQLIAYWFTASEVIPTLEALGNISAWVGIDKLPRLTYALWQVRAAWKLTGQDFRQFTQTWVSLWDELEKITGIAEIHSWNVAKLWITYEQVQQALANLWWENGRFGGLMEAQSQTFQWAISNIKDSINILGEQIWGVFLPFLTAIANVLKVVVWWISNFATSFPSLTAWIATFLWIAWVLITALWWYAAILPIITWLTTVFGTTLAVALWPISLIIWAIALLATGVSYLNNQSEKYIETSQQQQVEIGNLKAKQQELDKQYKSWAISQEEYTEQSRRLSRAMQWQQDVIDNTNSSRSAFFFNLRNWFIATFNASIEYVKWRWNTIVTNFGIIGRNITKAFSWWFSWLRSLAVFTLNWVLKTIADFINWYIQKINLLTAWVSKLTWLKIGAIGNVTAPQLQSDNWASVWWFESLVSSPNYQQIYAKEFEVQRKVAIEKKKAKDNANKAIDLWWSWWAWGGSSSKWWSSKKDDEEKKKADELKKQNDDFNTWLFNAVKKWAENARQEFDKIIDKIKKAKDELIDINKKIQELDTDTQWKLAQRFLEIKDTIAKGESNWALEAELQKIQSIVPENVLQEASRVAWLNTTDKILEDAEKARLKLEADKAIKEQEILQLETSKIDQQAIIDRYAQAQIDAERSLTSKLSIEKNNQIKIYEDYVRTIENLQARLSSASLPTLQWSSWDTSNSVTNNYNVNISWNGINWQSIANNLWFLTS